MFTFHLRTVICGETYLSGIRQSLDNLARNNPHWQYTLQPQSVFSDEEVHLHIVDCTGCSSPGELPADTANLLNSRKTLVLLRAMQRDMTTLLLNDYACSILCVDERHCTIRSLVETVMKNRRFLSPLMKREKPPEKDAEVIILTRTEHSILEYLRQGLSGVEISKLLFRSEKTVSTHKRNIMQKLGVSDDFALSKKIKLTSVLYE